MNSKKLIELKRNYEKLISEKKLINYDEVAKENQIFFNKIMNYEPKRSDIFKMKTCISKNTVCIYFESVLLVDADYIMSSIEKYNNELRIKIQTESLNFKTTKEMNNFNLFLIEIGKLLDKVSLKQYEKLILKGKDIANGIIKKEKDLNNAKIDYFEELNNDFYKKLKSVFDIKSDKIILNDKKYEKIEFVSYELIEEKTSFYNHSIELKKIDGKNYYFDNNYKIGRNKLKEKLEKMIYIKGVKIKNIDDITFFTEKIKSDRLDFNGIFSINNNDLDKIITPIINIRDF
jgi:hypothetical protein